MDLDRLQVLLQVVESGSIQGAARSLDVSRSSLRRRLDALEDEVGVDLLYRDAVGVRLTPAGAVLVLRARPLLEAAKGAVAEARAAVDEAAGLMRVIEPVGMPPELRAHGMLATRAALPKLRLEVRQVEDPLAHLDEPFELMVHEGDPPERGSWFSRVILRVAAVPLASPAYLRSRERPQAPADLADHTLLGWQRPGLPTDEWPLMAGGTVFVSPWLVSTDLLLWAKKGRRRATRGTGDDPYEHGKGCVKRGQPPKPHAITTRSLATTLRIEVVLPPHFAEKGNEEAYRSWGNSLGYSLRTGLRHLYMLDGTEIEFELEPLFQRETDAGAFPVGTLTFIDAAVGGSGFLDRAAAEFHLVPRQAAIDVLAVGAG